MAEGEGLEPPKDFSPADFKSVSSSSQMPSKKKIKVFKGILNLKNFDCRSGILYTTYIEKFYANFLVQQGLPPII